MLSCTVRQASSRLEKVSFLAPSSLVLGTSGDYTKEQYLQVEAYDFHDHPKITMKWT